MKHLTLVLTDVELSMVQAWQKFCGDLDFVKIHHGSILSLSVDAVVSPANSYGFMDGGIDLAYSHFFGWQIQEKLQKIIYHKYHGELLVGNAEIVETENPQIPFLIASPTMRVPMQLGNTVNPYLAARAVFLLWKYGIVYQGVFAESPISEVVQTIAIPGLGTGVGGVGVNTCAKQVRSAIDDFLLGKYTYPLSWADAQARHQKLYRDTVRDLQFEN